MKTAPNTIPRPVWVVPKLLAVATVYTVMTCSFAQAADPVGSRPEMGGASTSCATLPSESDRDNCRKDAHVRQLKARGELAHEQPEVLMSNALQRCGPLPQPLKADCVDRIKGHGNISGSVVGGGILRELITIEPASGTPLERPQRPD